MGSIKQVVCINGNEIYVNGEKINPPPKCNGLNVTQVDDKIYVNGYELIGGDWKRTIKAIFYYLF